MRRPKFAAAGASALAAALFFLSLAAGVLRAADAPAAPTPPPRPFEIDKNSVMVLIRTALIALQQANVTNNYTVLYALSSPGFQKHNTADTLSKIFTNLRGKHYDLSGVAVLDPQLTVLPEIYANGTMRMAGFFPSVPIQVYFDLQFTPVQGQWRLVSISVDVAGSSPPVPPTPNPALASPEPTTHTVAAPFPTLTPTPEVRHVVSVTPSPTPTPTPTDTPTASPHKNSKPWRKPNP